MLLWLMPDVRVFNFFADTRRLILRLLIFVFKKFYFAMGTKRTHVEITLKKIQSLQELEKGKSSKSNNNVALNLT